MNIYRLKKGIESELQQHEQLRRSAESGERCERRDDSEYRQDFAARRQVGRSC